jgi:hypothetical protein
MTQIGFDVIMGLRFWRSLEAVNVKGYLRWQIEQEDVLRSVRLH